MSAAAKFGTRLVRVNIEVGKSGFYFATSEDLLGLVVSGRTLQDLDAIVPEAISQLYEACGVDVIVTKVDKSNHDRNGEWVAVPTEIARFELGKRASRAA